MTDKEALERIKQLVGFRKSNPKEFGPKAVFGLIDQIFEELEKSEEN